MVPLRLFRAAHIVAAVLFVAAAGSVTSAAASSALVIVASSPDVPAPPGFGETVSIQLSGRAAVSDGPELDGHTPQERVESAKGLASGRGARLVVWLDVPPEGLEGAPAAERALYAVGLVRGNPELVSTTKVPAGDGPEALRALGLDVGEAMGEIARRTRRAEDDADDGSTSESASSDGASGDERSAAAHSLRRRSHALVSTGLGLAPVGGNIGALVELIGAAGVAQTRGPRRLEVVAALGRPSPSEVQAPAGTVAISGVSAGVGGRYLVPAGELSAGGHSSLWLSRISAHARAATGETGSVRRLVPVVRFGPELRWDLSPQVALRAAGSAEVAMRRQQFAIRGNLVSDMGRVRLGVRLGVVVLWP